MIDFDDFISALKDSDFEEKPVGVEEFVTSEYFLGLPPLSEYQYMMVRAGSQIYKLSTLEDLYGLEEAIERFKHTYNEIIMQLGKGSGKDHTATIICAYVVYLLLCLKDPAKYYGKPPGDSIDVINIAINAQQASNVFFKGFVNKITNSPWFMEKYDKKEDGRPARNNEVNFIKNVNVYSGHSERESWEGYNVILVILDEIAGFAVESTSGNANAKTAEAVYRMYRGSVDSRFPDYGKILLLSWPRYRDDFIQQRYNSVIADVDTIKRYHKFKLDETLPDGLPGNEFEISWDEDHIQSYTVPRVFALKRPTWEVNPLRHVEEFKRSFHDDLPDALMRFACMPPYATDALFKSREQLERSFVSTNGIDSDGTFFEDFKPIPNKEYFIHIDLAQKHDRCAVAMSHAEKWVQMEENFLGETTIAPYIVVDLVKWWTPSKDKSVDFSEVKEFVLDLRRRGFDIKMVTFDRWNSHDMMMQLRQSGLNSDILSVAKKHYDDFKIVVMEQRLRGPAIDILLTELLRLQIIRDKVDHPRSGSKDLADAVCGSIFNTIKLAKRDSSPEVHLYTYDTLEWDTPEQPRPNLIEAPKRNMPENVKTYLDSLRVI